MDTNNFKIGDKIIFKKGAPSFYIRRPYIISKIYGNTGVVKLNKEVFESSIKDNMYVHTQDIIIDKNSLRKKKLKKLQRKIRWERILRLGIG